MESVQNTNTPKSLLDTLPENAVQHLVNSLAVKRYKEEKNLENFDLNSVSKDELKTYIKDDDVVEYQKQNLEKNNKLFEEYGLPPLKYEELVGDDVVLSEDNDKKEFYNQLWLSQKEKGIYLPYFENLIETHKERKMKYVGNIIVPNEEEMKVMRQRIEQMMRQFQQQEKQQKQQKQQKQSKQQPEPKNKALHKSILKLNNDRETRLARMKAKLSQRQSEK
jgi:hypothetical protein